MHAGNEAPVVHAGNKAPVMHAGNEAPVVHAGNKAPVMHAGNKALQHYTKYFYLQIPSFLKARTQISETILFIPSILSIDAPIQDESLIVSYANQTLGNNFIACCHMSCKISSFGIFT